jgi:BMFP domain-containing protein YqiC
MNDISTNEINARLIALTRQRNEALDRIVMLEGAYAVEIEKTRSLAEELAKLEARITQIEAKPEDPAPAKD